MKAILSLAVCLALSIVSSAEANPKETKVTGPLQFKLKDINDKDVDLSQYLGKVVLLVNVASECGYTPQYKGLQELHEKHGKDGVVVIGIPSNEFGRQEPGTNADILKFCQNTYKVSFPMMGKVVIKGDGKVPLYKFLTEKETNPKFAGEVGWNFEKFLIGKNGEVVGRFKSSVEPMSDTLINAIKAELK